MVTPADEYRTAAETVVSNFRDELGVELKYDEQSIEWLDGYINRIRTQFKKDSYPGLAVALGAYLGETIIATYGGAWDYFEKLDQWGIRLPDDNGAFPISKVYKQLEDGEFDSVLSFFTMLPKVLAHINKQQASD
jgi:hypothetical protein